ncbi:hypothetical protein CONLIGDRAFT_141575 [Coniochaeta ligniaria NRRL 30616]|uniref:Uncharacterized protein n=1 Tax=Coniochaeta ligniaria NRRL 30616 TaxID=1408157 RepID=A0A1J7J016_9PEZI|nr:hypothetical protein CONLIGDRAFT_141575 [Coniochaeta ligniaria NRRL 30616]
MSSPFFKVTFMGNHPMTWTPQGPNDACKEGSTLSSSSLSSAGPSPQAAAESSDSEEGADSVPAWKGTIPTTREGLMQRLFVLEPQFRHRKFCAENYQQSPVESQRAKQQLAGWMQLGLDGFVSRFRPAGDLLNPEETKKMTLAGYQAELNTVLQNAMPAYTECLSAIWANANERITPSRWPLAGLVYPDEKPQGKGKGKKWASTVHPPATPPSKRLTRSTSSRSGPSPASPIPVHPSPAGQASTSAHQATPAQASPLASMPSTPEGRNLTHAQLVALEEQAQTKVVDAYKRAADTGAKPVVGAHIWAKATKLHEAKMGLLEQILSAMFPYEVVEQLFTILKERPAHNIFPLSPNGHTMMDKLLVALRPVLEPGTQEDDKSNTTLYIQFDLELGLDVNTGRKVASEFLNGYQLQHVYPQEGSDCTSFVLRHGDVIKIEALAVDKHPLPHYELLRWHYALHRFAAAFKAGGKVPDLFRGPKPRGPPVPSRQATASEQEEEVLKVAVEQGIITQDEADIWRGEYIRYTEELEEAMRIQRHDMETISNVAYQHPAEEHDPSSLPTEQSKGF